MERFINLIGAVIILITFLPCLVFVALCIRLDSRGPCIFKQTRVGKDNSHFTLYKFRTMHVGTPDLPSDRVPNNDPRFTRLGKYLRQLSIDELPQLINIIKGNMNFIGPRPALYNQDELITMRKEAGVNRLKPGVTGWAQVNGRENISLDRKVQLDKYYLENRSFFLDLKILWLTLIKSLKGSDLYYKKPDVSTDQERKNISLK